MLPAKNSNSIKSQEHPIVVRDQVMCNLNRCLTTLKYQLLNPKFCVTIAHAHSRPSKNPSINNPAIRFVLNEVQEVKSTDGNINSPAPMEEQEFSPLRENGVTSIQVSHPWPEWVRLMEILLKNGYFAEIGNPFEKNGILGNKEANSIRTACLNFGRDHYQFIRCLSRKDILVIAESGCPSTDRKVVNSGKRLRAHVGIDEGNVCNTCILRGNCDRAYVKFREEEGGRTVDVMRFLLTYGLDPIIGSVENKQCLKESVKESVKTLLKEMVEMRLEGDGLEPTRARTGKWVSSTEEVDVDRLPRKINVPMKQGDWICPKCTFLNFSRNAKCLRCDDFIPERLKRLSEEQENLPLKKGDWICDKCDMLNFARNTRCYQCKEKPPKRQLILGDWECDSCNYINFRRNMVCLKCDHRRYIAPQQTHQTQQPWSSQGKRSGNERGDSWKFVENVSEDHGNSSSWDEETGFMIFPVVGGTSDLSQNLEKQELWKKQMTGKSRSPTDHAKEDEGRYQYPKFLEKSEVAAGDDEDDMAEWFEGPRNPAQRL